MHETIQEASPSSKEPMRKRWQIAWVHNGDVGGAKRFTFEMVARLSARGHVIDEYIVSGPVRNGEYLSLKPFVRTSSELIVRHPDLSWLRPYLLSTCVQLGATLWTMHKIKQTFQALAGVINTARYDFVHMDQYTFCRAIGVLPHLRRPTVVYIHEASAMRYQQPSCNTGIGPKSAFRSWYASLCELAGNLNTNAFNKRDLFETRFAQAVLTNSYYSKEIFFQRYGRHSSVCYLGVDSEVFRPASLPVEPMLLCAGRIVRAKQYHLVIEAVGMIERSLRPHVVFATPECIDRLAQPRYAEELSRLAKDKEVDLTIKYRPSQQELVSLYNQALALVFIPLMEPFGLVALEAMACGTPVIGVREAGIRETVIDGVTGILVDREPIQIAAAITRLQQQETRTQMSRRGVEEVHARWSWEHTVDRYEEEVQKLLYSREHAAQGTLNSGVLPNNLRTNN